MGDATAGDGSAPFDGVLFDFHATLITQGSGAAWLAAAWRRDGRRGTPADALGAEDEARLARRLELIWETAREVDPANLRDLDVPQHRRVFDELVTAMGPVAEALSDALYATLTDGWTAYDDAVPVLGRLRARGLRTALVSNMVVDIADVLARTGIGPLLDAVVLSGDVGVAKPGPAIFRIALERIGVAPERALMVGDSWRDDAGAAELGVRTLVLPRTDGPVHGLAAVARLVEA